MTALCKIIGVGAVCAAVVLAWATNQEPIDSSGRIVGFGSFPSPDKRLVLKIEKRNGTLVHLAINDASNRQSLYADEIGSDAMRWCAFWDTENQLWAYSGDTSTIYRVAVDNGGKLNVSKALDGVGNIERSAYPKPIYDFLPNSLKRRLDTPTKTGTQSANCESREQWLVASRIPYPASRP